MQKIITNPYETTMGKATPLRDVPKDYLKYLLFNLGTNLSYEVLVNSECKIAFITGYCREEQELPFLEQPLVLEVNNHPVVIYDVRKYVKKVQDKPATLKEIFSNSSAYELIVTHALLLKDFNLKNYGVVKPIEKNIGTAFALFLGNIVNYLITLDPIEKLKVEIAIAYYFYFLTVEDHDIKDHKDAIMNKILNSSLSLKIPNIKFVEETLMDCITEIKDVNTLISNINFVLPEEKRGYVTITNLVARCRNMWYGPGGDIILLMGLECVPNLYALINSGLNDKSYKRSIFSMTLDKFSSKIKAKEVEQFFTKYLDDNTI